MQELPDVLLIATGQSCCCIAETNLAQLVDRAAAGEEIIIAKNGVPLARLVSLEARPARRIPGGWEHGVRIADDFDAPLRPDLLAALGA